MILNKSKKTHVLKNMVFSIFLKMEALDKL
nr:MAG TPA: hypothetical protein [Caudoviricetes sp.]